MKFLICIVFLVLLIGFSEELDNDSNSTSDSDVNTESTPLNQNLREARSNNFFNVFKNSDVQSHLKKTNPHLLRYFSSKEGHVFNDIMRKLSNETNNDFNQTIISSQESGLPFNQIKNYDRKEIEYEGNSGFNDDNFQQQKKPLFDENVSDYESMHAHETQATKDSISKLSTMKDLIPTSLDNRNPTKSGHYVPNDSGSLYDYLSCCDQLFNKYGTKNYLHEDVVYVIPKSEEYSSISYSYPHSHGHGPVLFPSKSYVPSSRNHHHHHSMFDREGRIPLIPSHKDFPKNKIIDFECIEHIHSIDPHGGGPVDVHLPSVHRLDSTGHLPLPPIPRVELPGSSSERLIPVHHVDGPPGALSSHFEPIHPHGHFVPIHRIDGSGSSGEHLVPVRIEGPGPSTGHLVPINSHDHVVPVPIPSPGQIKSTHRLSSPSETIGGTIGQLLPISPTPGQSVRAHRIDNGLGTLNGQTNIQARHGSHYGSPTYPPPPIFYPPPPPIATPSMVLTRKLGLLSKKYLLG